MSKANKRHIRNNYKYILGKILYSLAIKPKVKNRQNFTKKAKSFQERRLNSVYFFPGEIKQECNYLSVMLEINV